MKTKLRRASSETWTRELAELICRRRGWHFLSTSWTERYPIAGKGNWRTVKRDLFAMLDALAITSSGPGARLVGIQFTDAHNMPARLAKMRANEWTPLLLAAGVRLVCWGFEENGALREERVELPVVHT
jgi:hypothetical protein